LAGNNYRTLPNDYSIIGNTVKKPFLENPEGVFYDSNHITTKKHAAAAPVARPAARAGMANCFQAHLCGCLDDSVTGKIVKVLGSFSGIGA